MTKKVVIVVGALLALVLLVRLALPERHVANAGVSPQTGAAATPEELDRLLAPVALYPDQLLGQILICAQNPGNVDALNLWLGKNQTLKGSELQDAVANQGFEPSFVTLALFPQVVKMMADQLDWTTNLGVAFTSDRSAVFASIQRLRKKASDVGTLKTTPQQEVETRTTSSGQEVIVIEPANPQVVYVPQYNSTTIYTQAPTTTTVVVESDNSAEVAAAGMIGFTAGIAMGAAFSNPYYYGPYGWHGGGYMYNDAWDDYYDAPRGRARRLDGPPGRHRRGARRSRQERSGTANRPPGKPRRRTDPTRKDSGPSVRRTGRRTARAQSAAPAAEHRYAGRDTEEPQLGQSQRRIARLQPRRQNQQAREQSAAQFGRFLGVLAAADRNGRPASVAERAAAAAAAREAAAADGVVERSRRTTRD